MKKKDAALLFLTEHLSLFRCPVCQKDFQHVSNAGPVCKKGHSFDVSKKGTVHFLLKSSKNDYGHEMLAYRQKMMVYGLFDPILQNIRGKIQTPSGPVLDVGCGEGTHLSKLSALGLDGPKIGFDISKEGIQLAAASSPNPFWCVADLSQSPFGTTQFSTILNILSPSHYSEFHRLLAKNGQLIKVVPEENYLIELRQAFYENEDKKEYSNQDVVARFAEELPTYDMERVTYVLEVPETHKEALMNMTPLSWNVSDDVRAAYLEEGPNTVTIDVLILCAKKI